MPARISVVLNTLNEEARLPYSLRSVRAWADEVVVVDMRSDDRTAEVARSFGAVVHLHDRVGYVEPARAFAVAQSSGDWVLVLDADELVPRGLAQRLVLIAGENSCDVVRLPRQNWILGVPLGHTGWGASQDGQLRFFRRDALELSDDIHRGMAPRPGARVLDLTRESEAALVHFSHTDVEAFAEKTNRYTSIEAAAGHSRGERPSIARAVTSAARQFAARYWRYGGWRDGWRGFHLSALMAFYQLATEAKLAELDAGVTRESSIARYRAEAERLLAEYERPGGPPPAP